ncbi:MAG TPA: anti-sigma factor antagonist [bacterium (Candidatus Stahlbacteria)]|nr:anti-sigma factor antagonist [Candidatus Stahlbacteria bacterium]
MRVSVENEVCFLSLNGEIDEDSFKSVEAKLRELLRKGNTKLVLDLSRLKHINYQLIGSLIGWQKRYKDFGGDIKLVNVSAYIYDILRLYGFYPFEIYPTRRAAIKGFS